MRLVIESADFRKLSKSTQRELLKHFAGAALFVNGRRDRTDDTRRPSSYEWRTPIDLTHDLTIQLMHRLGGPHRKRLALFARGDGRVSMRQLLRASGDSDPRVLSYFQSVVTRKLRRILGDVDKQALLIAWDYESTKWDKAHTQIVDGDYYVTPRSAEMLRTFFGL